MKNDFVNLVNEHFNSSIEDKLVSKLFNELGHENFKPGLDRLRPTFSKFNFSNKKIITIGGTNGKGETSFYLYHALVSSGKRVGLWTSPHILSLRERFCLSDGPVSYERLEAVVEKGLKTFKKGELSFYEFLFWCFCSLVEQDDCDYIIFEVGLGGRYDAVNLFDANLCAITSISRDHTEILGKDTKKILFEKLGITRAKTPALMTVEQSHLRKFARDYCQEHGVELYDLYAEGKVEKKQNYSQRNKILARELFLRLGGDISYFSMSLMLKGRFEKMTRGQIRFIFIGAHNLDGIRKLKDLLLSSDKQEERDFLMSFSKRSEQDILDCLGVWAKAPCLYDKLLVCSFEHQKSAGAVLQELCAKVEFPESKLLWLDNWKDYLIELYNQQKPQTIYVSGSYYFIGELQRFILANFS
ncbi:hypothetical protein HBN50_06235 [Halobacteriovorax sp. GB3]|uniref:hypothetical protein n=1 Tax=Halobacteriovorax sp. GB3 TaxID=2719615 RepID=UPI0023609908|nr:hypothetical protein [Halobacteriovorax sp. GB3]MDD0852685.1 hypothetical protein [Halobacteriovorax sp. GB3]